MKMKCNWVDVLIVILVVATLAVGIWFLFGRGEAETVAEDKTVRCTLELTKEAENFAMVPKAGDVVYLGEKDRACMTVTEVEVTPCVAQGKNLVDGTYVDEQVPGYYDVYITMEAPGSETDAAVMVDNVALRVGYEAVAKSKNWVGEGYLVSVETEPNAPVEGE